MWTVVITCILFGIIIGYIIGGKEGVDSCGEVFMTILCFATQLN